MSSASPVPGRSTGARRGSPLPSKAPHPPATSSAFRRLRLAPCSHSHPHSHLSSGPTLVQHVLSSPLLVLLPILLLLGEGGVVRGASAAAAPSWHALGSGWALPSWLSTQRLGLEFGLGQKQIVKAGQGSRGEQGMEMVQGLNGEQGLEMEQGLRGEQGTEVEQGSRGEQGLSLENGQGARGGEQAVTGGAALRMGKARRQRQGTGARARVLRERRLVARAQQAAGAPQPASICSKLPVYDSAGKVIRTAKGLPLTLKDWTSRAETSFFLAGPCLTVSAIHIVQTPARTVVVIDRSDGGSAYGGVPVAPKKPFFAVELNLGSRVQRPLDIIKDAFCSTGTLMPDGSFVNIGGFQLGVSTMRGFQACTDGSCNFELLGKMRSPRWYPTAQLLGNGRVLIVGGQKRSGSLNNPMVNSPSVEYWPPGPEGLVTFPFLTRTLPHNQYPIVHLLPSGLVFMFAGQEYTLFNTVTNKEVVRAGGYPTLRLTDNRGRPIFRCSPSTAATALLPLGPANGYKAEVIICGGPKGVFRPNGNQILETADDMCWSIFPDVDSPKPVWVGDRMCYDHPTCTLPAPRVVGQAVLLADGAMLIVGGASKGFAGYRSPGPPTSQPLMYYPTSRTWYSTPLATSYVPRLYHSTAILLHDATVFLAGSGPNIVDNTTNLYYPTESRSEFFYPPYLMRGPSPSLTSAPASVPINSLFTICFKSGRSRMRMSDFRFALSFSGFATHGMRHGMRHVNLEVVSIQQQAPKAYGVTLRSPPNLNIAPPSAYWLFVLERGVPNREGRAVKITPPDGSNPTFPLSRCRNQ